MHTNSRERVISTFKFENGQDTLRFDGKQISDQLLEYYVRIWSDGRREDAPRSDGLQKVDKYREISFFTEVRNKINKDFVTDENESLTNLTVSDAVFIRPFANADVEQVEALMIPELDETSLPDFKAFRDKCPEHAVILSSGAPPLFMSACEVFGFEETLVKIDCRARGIRSLHKKAA